MAKIEDVLEELKTKIVDLIVENAILRADLEEARSLVTSYQERDLSAVAENSSQESEN